MSDGRARAVQALVSVIDETRLLFHRLKRTAESLHLQGELTAGRRGVLESLHRRGPQTVPQLARARPVSRQHIQQLVDPLAEEGLVEFIDNPRHRRSRLVRLTAAGRRMVREIARRERPVLEALSAELATDELEQAATLLARLRRRLADADIEELVRTK